ncbi:hypothetical protein BC940DRAFT_321886 [Gongronella butleri]|nr:hypothetical protein BC940DRAFT_321886 [Gongronella butleri]
MAGRGRRQPRAACSCLAWPLPAATASCSPPTGATRPATPTTTAAAHAADDDAEDEGGLLVGAIEAAARLMFTRGNKKRNEQVRTKGNGLQGRFDNKMHPVLRVSKVVRIDKGSALRMQGSVHAESTALAECIPK